MQITTCFSHRIILRWLPFAAVATIMSGLVCAAVQLDLRMTANDPQIQMAEDAAAALGAGQQIPTSPPQTTDVAKSLATFLVIYDDQGKVLASNAKLDDKPMPTLPVGVFNYTRAHNVDRVTWQPRPGVRIAAVVMRYQGTTPGFVLAGRSLREVEVREKNLAQMVGLAWLIAMVSTYALVALASYKKEPKPAITA